MSEPTEKDYEKLLKRLRSKDPNWKLKGEFGGMLMRHIDSFSDKEMERYNELKKLLAPKQEKP